MKIPLLCKQTSSHTGKNTFILANLHNQYRKQKLQKKSHWVFKMNAYIALIIISKTRRSLFKISSYLDQAESGR